MRKIIVAVVGLVAMLLPAGAQSQLINYGKPDKFIETQVHLLLGGSYVTENYKSCFKEISDVNNSMGFAWGVGFRAKFNLTSFVGIGTELNYLRNSGKLEISTSSDTQVTNNSIKNNYRTFNVPVFASFTFNLAPSVKWNADGGLYMSFGTGGKQKVTTYSATMNDLGQLIIAGPTTQKKDYYKNDRGFLNSYRDFDMGLHLGTGLSFMNKVSIGFRCQFGFRNVAMGTSTAKIVPNSHNVNVFATAGYIF
ncbi:MAG: PorT family protein [Duncaniella sp.]|uniref:porin family protein n=1 Tax=Duncaniella sp. TaxID=2518496 RepID=UPI0023BC0D7C|nr:porin family protein [Duncaniella sp.]MDE5988637.1 PorT family protein [Duncaniella sp.]MDE6174391.1 PorT family protein [Duncaniella sp.]